MAAERSRKRKRNQEEAIAKIKKGKEAKKAVSKKKKKKGSDDDSDFEDLMDTYKSRPLPGQLENCELCNKRFTVTPYSKAGPEGGLLCTPCGKELTKENKASEKAKKPVVRKGRRKIESNRLDGMIAGGPKSLQQLCIEKLAKHSEDIDELGEMPENIMNRISEIFSKSRAMNPTTMKLFLQPGMDKVAIHEAACKFCALLTRCQANASQRSRQKTTTRFLPFARLSRSLLSAIAVSSRIATWII